MTDQLYIDDTGQIDAQPLTWDGEPVYSPASVQEGLFEALAFEQMPGQIAIEGQFGTDREYEDGDEHVEVRYGPQVLSITTRGTRS